MIFNIITISCYSIVGIASLIMGLIYLLSKKFTNYHAQAVNKKWDEIDEKVRIVMLALLKLGGVGFFITGISMIGVLDILYKNFIGFLVATVIGLFFWISSLIITARIKYLTKANSPVLPSLLNVVLLFIGVISSIFVYIK
jgi:hypothetical protein